MRFLEKCKDGGPESPVDAYFLFEIKSFASVALLKFNKGHREAYHTHAFNAFTWFLWGDLWEQTFDGELHEYERGILPKFTAKDRNHRVLAEKDSWCFTIRGPWESTWTEDHNGTTTTFAHGRKVVKTEENTQ